MPARALCYTPAKMDALLGLECAECQGTFEADRLQTVCAQCDSPLLARYDLARLKDELDRDRVTGRPAGLWRWAELLPVRDAAQAHRLTLGEGDTPLLRAPRLGAELGLVDLWIKDEGRNPTGTFKARGLAVAVARAAELGVRDFVIPTAGNAGGALAAYAGRGNLRAHVFMPADAPQANQAEVLAAGAELHLVAGRIDEAGRQAASAAQANGWFDLSTFKEPYRLEGKKTLGLELAQEFSWDLPDIILYPTGGGTGLVGMWKAFAELEALGWIEERKPLMVSVQSSGCAPVVTAWERGAERVEKWQDPSTFAAGLSVPAPYADRLILRCIRESGGGAFAVPDADIRAAQAELAAKEGVLACPEGGAALAGLRCLIDEGWLRGDERIVLFNTGTALKYLT